VHAARVSGPQGSVLGACWCSDGQHATRHSAPGTNCTVYQAHQGWEWVQWRSSGHSPTCSVATTLPAKLGLEGQLVMLRQQAPRGAPPAAPVTLLSSVSSTYSAARLSPAAAEAQPGLVSGQASLQLQQGLCAAWFSHPALGQACSYRATAVVRQLQGGAVIGLYACTCPAAPQQGLHTDGQARAPQAPRVGSSSSPASAADSMSSAAALS
jgi:hypothetical protein